MQETEELCRLYIDCKLSVFEETEFRYILTQVDYHSPLIDEARQIMEVEVHISDKPNKIEKYKKRTFRKWLLPVSVAASIALIFSIGVTLFTNSATGWNSDEPYYMAYSNGNRLNDGDARLKIEDEKKSVDEFIKEMSELEAEEKQMMENFFNL